MWTHHLASWVPPILEVNDYYAVNLEDSQIMPNKDIHIMFFSKLYITHLVYFFTFLQIKYNWKTLFTIYFHSPNTRMAISATGHCKCWLQLDETLWLIKAFIVIWFWLERPRVWYWKKAEQKTILVKKWSLYMSLY